MTRGAFITVEGGEGVGKSSSLAAIEGRLRERAIEARLTREPGGTRLGEAVRSWILDGEHGALGADVEALLMFAARAEHVERLIRPAMTAGIWVVCDRFSDATLAYQGGGRGADRAFLETLAHHVQAGIVPDLTLLLDAPIEVGMARIADRPHDHFERENRAFFERVRQAYLDLAAAEPARFRVIDASAPRDAVLAAIAGEIDRFCERYAAAGAVGT